MIRIVQVGSVIELHLDTKTAGCLGSALIQARPQGTAEAKSPEHTIRVHVHGKAAPSPPQHEPIDPR